MRIEFYDCEIDLLGRVCCWTEKDLMCGRTVCSLGPAHLCLACERLAPDSGEVHWRNDPTNQGTYTPSYNLAPSDFGPVLMSASQNYLSNEYSSRDLVIQPMKWGLVPSWFKGQPSVFQYKMVNARVETVNEKASYRNAISKGQRCVILADGFYEWQQSGGAKQPYFIHFPQEKKVKFEESEHEIEGQKWTGRRLLTMAGIFDISAENSDEPLYTYTVITVPASESLKWLHDRMPAVLETTESVQEWLNFDKVPVAPALSLLKPIEALDYFPVSKSVNSVKIKDSQCVKPVQLESKKHQLVSSPPKGMAPLTKYFKPKPK